MAIDRKCIGRARKDLLTNILKYWLLDEPVLNLVSHRNSEAIVSAIQQGSGIAPRISHVSSCASIGPE